MIKKLISIALSLCLLNALCIDVYSAAALPINPVVDFANVALTDSFIPSDLGKVVDDVYIGAEKTIVNIQDLHSDKNTQENIAEILDYLTKNYNIENIYLEGAVEELDFNWLKVIKDEKVRKSIADKLLSDGKITGAEYFGLFNENPKIKFKGLEEEKIYKENFVILSKMYENKDVLEKKIADISKALAEAKVYTYNFFIRSLDELIDVYKNGYISQSNYFLYLVSLSKKTDIPDFKYKTISKYLELEKFYGSLKLNKIKKELSDINSILKEQMTYEQYSRIKQLYEKYPIQYYKEIKSFLDNKFQDASKKYNNFYKFCDYLQKQSSLDLQLLFNEEKNILSELYYSFSKTTAERNLIFLNDYTAKLHSFFMNEITASEYEYVRENSKKYFILLENYISKTDIAELKNWYEFVDKFYSNNEKRNKIFLENIYDRKINGEDILNQTVIKNENRKSFGEILKITGQPVDVIVTGGYHSRGMKPLMDGLDINYAVIMPDVKSANVIESKNKFYQDYMKQLSILNNTYQKFIRSSLMNETWDDPAKVIAVGFLDYDLLSGLFAYYKNNETVKENVSAVQQYISDIFKEKGLNDDTRIENIESVDGCFLLTFMSNGKERLFFVSENAVKEISSTEEIKNIVAEKIDGQAADLTKKGNASKLLKRLSIFAKMVFLFPVMILMGAVPTGGAVTGNKVKKNSLLNKGADITNVDFTNVVFEDTIFEQGAEISLKGHITLDNVYVGNENIFKITAANRTTVTVKNIDIREIGELDIDIQADGEFEVVREDGIVKIYKVLRTDFSAGDKKRRELVSVLNKGKIFLASEDYWEMQNDYPIVVFYSRYTKWSDTDKIKKRSETLYGTNKVVYIEMNEIESWLSSKDRGINEENFKTILKKSGLLYKNICVDCSMLDDKGVSMLYSIQA